MASLNMVKVNTLFRKGYLLAGVVMAANMFAVNEVKAMDSQTGAANSGSQESGQGTENQFPNNTTVFKEEEKKEEGDHKKQSSLDKLLSWENYFNLFGTLALSGANSYFKWWDYNAGSYCKLRIGCLGWRTKKFFDTVQLDFNLNLGRGAIWLIPHIINLILEKTSAEKDEKSEKDDNFSWVRFFFSDILRGFTSMPLTFHISNFSISISLDSIIWMGIDKKFFKDKDEQGEGAKNPNMDPKETVPIDSENNQETAS